MKINGHLIVTMDSLRGQCFLVLFAVFPIKVHLLENGLAQTPPMGWMSWGYYMCGDNCKKNPEKCLNEELIISVADAFYKQGYQEAGYEYIIIDDCWSELQRDHTNRLVPNKRRFPRGMKFLADYIHSKGLKFGMYTNIAAMTCMHFPGSRGHFKLDAQTFAEWDVDYLKVDGCFVEEDYLNHAYIDLGKQLNSTGRPMVFSCSWPYYIQYIHNKTPDYMPIMKHCNLWRNFHDVFLNWPSIKFIINYYTRAHPTLAKYHGPGHWNDPDMLIFGTGVLTESQSRVQLAVYAMMSAPLLLSCPMDKITPHEKRLLQNMDLIAIAQDPLGIMATPHQMTADVTLWVKTHLPMKGDQYPSYSFALVNLGNSQLRVNIVPSDYGLNSPDGYSIMDVFTQKFLANITMFNTIPIGVPPEDVVLYTLFPL